MTTDNRSVLFSSATDNWPTPQDFYDRLDAEFNFGLDVCSSKANHKAPAFYALDHDNPHFRDGLAADWAADSAGRTIWCNPPYGRGIRDWMESALAAAHLGGATVVCLVPVRADSAWWQDLVLESGAEVRYVRGRLKFGDAKNSAAFASAVVIYRPTDVLGEAGPVRTMLNKVAAPDVADRTNVVDATASSDREVVEAPTDAWERWNEAYQAEQVVIAAEYDRAVEMAAGFPRRHRAGAGDARSHMYVVRESDQGGLDMVAGMRAQAYEQRRTAATGRRRPGRVPQDRRVSGASK